MSTSSDSGRGVAVAPNGANHGEGSRRSRLMYVLVGFALLFQLLVAANAVHFLGQPTCGFGLFRPGFEGHVVAFPIHVRAEEAVENLTRPLRLISANGTQLSEVPPFALRAFEQQFIKTKHGESNAFVLQDHTGKRTRLIVPVDDPDLAVVIRTAALRFLSHLAGLLYLAVGLLVWWLRPRDRAAAPLLLMGMAASINMSLNLRHTLASAVLGSMQMAVLPLWGLAGFFLAIQFTGSMDRFWVRWVLRWGSGLVFATTAVALPSWFAVLVGAGGSLLLVKALLLLGGLEAFVSVLGMFALCWQPLRQRRSLGLRRRARVFAAASLISFLFPSATIILMAAGFFSRWLEASVLVSLSLFPIFIGYAIVRHQMFDFRIMLQRGVVYGGLTLVASLAYVALVLVGLRFASRSAPSPLLLALLAAVVVAAISLVHMRVQRAVNRFVHRKSALYASALASASAALAEVRSLEAIAGTVRQALVNVMGLTGAYFAVVQDDDPALLRCTLLEGNTPDHATPLPRLPHDFEVATYAPLARAVNSEHTVTTHDSDAVAAQSEFLAEGVADVFAEAGFWSYFGVEAIIPLILGAGAPQSRVVGLLVLQPKADHRPLGLEEYEMLSTLANQLAVAVESCNALEEVKRLNEGLEQQVMARTEQLAAALEELKQAQGQLVESEMQAMLGNLVAGIVHELNSPLGTMRSSVQSLETTLCVSRPLIEGHPDRDDPQVGKALRSITVSGQLLEVLASSEERIRAVLGSLGRFVNLDEAEVKPLDLKRSVSDAVTLVAPSLGKQIQVTTAFPPSPVVVPCYPARMNKVFLNLLQNAAEAIDDDGEIRVTLDTTGDKVTVLFEDTGRGIPRNQLTSLFDLGFTTKAGGRVGMRLGLPFARRWVQEVGGEIAITSEVGKGTTAKVELPATDLG